MAKNTFIIVVGASAGGTLVLPQLVRQLKPDMNIAVFVALHLANRGIAEMLIQRLQKHTTLECSIPQHNEAIQVGHLYLAPPDYHMLLKKDRILLGQGPMENRYRPSIDALFRSAAVEYGSSAIGIVMTGLLEDGTSGMFAIKQAGGACIIQDPDEAKYPDMPLSVVRNLKPDYSVPVDEMGKAILKITAKPRKKKKIPQALIKEAQIAESANIGLDNLKGIANKSVYSCPDCGGGLWEIEANGEKRYRCHVGHAFTEPALLNAMETTTETALWTALRIIEERKNLLAGIAAKEKRIGRKNVAAQYANRLKELEKQIDELKKVLFWTTQH